MNIQQAMRFLENIYHIHETFASNVNRACLISCSTCCTCNVTATTIEGLMIYDHLIAMREAPLLKLSTGSAPIARYRPKVTINHLADLCTRGNDLPEEANHPNAGVCPFLDDHLCRIYPVRPFGCRAMLSSTDCSQVGEARMPSFMLTVNNVIMQYLEAADSSGGTGNLLDVLTCLSNDALREDYRLDKGIGLDMGMLSNRALTVLMVPPEHRSSILPLIESIKSAVRETC